MEVGVSIGRSIIVDDDVHPLNVNSTAKDVSGDKDTFFESLERGVSADTKRSCQVSSPELEGE